VRRGAARPAHSAAEASQSAELRRKLELVSEPYADASRALWGHPRLAELFVEYLIRTHTIIRASVPLMEAARACADGLAAGDSVAAGVARYLAHHSREERHHDDWLLADIAALGVSRETVLARMPSATVAALVGSQYYWMYHYHPVVLLGYIAVLEGTPPSATHVAEVMTRTGLPGDAFRTILKHAELDPHHRDGLDRALDALPLTPSHRSTIAISAFSTVQLLTRSLVELLESNPRP